MDVEVGSVIAREYAGEDNGKLYPGRGFLSGEKAVDARGCVTGWVFCGAFLDLGFYSVCLAARWG